MIEETPLYDGQLTLVFDSGRHSYRIKHPNGRCFKIPSVTRITGILDKPALVPWAVNCSLDVVRTSIVPDTSYSETFLEEVFRQAKGRSRGVKEEAADIGKQAHAWLEAYAKGKEPVLPSEDSPIRKSLDSALQWLSKNKVRFLSCERAIYSRQNRYSGRLDGYAEVEGVPTILDWKTSNGVYLEYVLQVAAYAAALSEELGTKISHATILRIGKDGTFEPYSFGPSELKRAYGMFLSALNIWKGQEKLNRSLKNQKLASVSVV